MTKVAEVKLNPTPELEALAKEIEEDVPAFPLSEATTHRQPSEDMQRVLSRVAELLALHYESLLIAQGSRELADEMLETTRQARAAQIRALPIE